MSILEGVVYSLHALIYNVLPIRSADDRCTRTQSDTKVISPLLTVVQRTCTVPADGRLQSLHTCIVARAALGEASTLVIDAHLAPSRVKSCTESCLPPCPSRNIETSIFDIISQLDPY